MDTAGISAELECPVCFSTLKPPTHACELGHTICEDCYRRLPGRHKSCPECRKPLVMRNFALERLLTKVPQPCENKDSGCDVVLVADQLRGHQQGCPWRKIPCPFPTCAHLELLHNYNNHVQEEHALYIFDVSTTGEVSFDVTLQQDQQQSVFFLRDQQSRNILPYSVNLSLDLTTNQLHVCVCSWQEDGFYSATITTLDNTSLNVSCSLRTVPVSRGDAAAWKTHPQCFFMNSSSIGVRRDCVVNVVVVLKLDEEQELDSGDTKKRSAMGFGAAEEEQLLTDLGKFINKDWWSVEKVEENSKTQNFEGVMKKILEEHEKMCVWQVVDCVIDGCEEVVLRKDLWQHVFDSHKDASFWTGGEDKMVSIKELRSLATRCTGQIQCHMKSLVVGMLKRMEFWCSEKPCGLPSCTARVSDRLYRSHIQVHHKDIAKWNLNATTFPVECSNLAECIPMHVLSKLTKAHTVMCPQSFGMCPVGGCPMQTTPTDADSHIARYHKNIILDARGWSESMPVSIPNFNKYNRFDLTYFLAPEGRFRNYRLLKLKRDPIGIFLFFEGSDSENISFCMTIKTLEGGFVMHVGLGGQGAYLPLFESCKAAKIKFTT